MDSTTIWKVFEKTGWVGAYMLYRKSIDSDENISLYEMEERQAQQ